jgi:hypothetical protein
MVVLIGVNKDGFIGVIGKYESTAEARSAIDTGFLPPGYSYSVFSAPPNSWVEFVPPQPNVDG